MEHLLTYYIIINCVELQFRGAMLLRAQTFGRLALSEQFGSFLSVLFGIVCVC